IYQGQHDMDKLSARFFTLLLFAGSIAFAMPTFAVQKGDVLYTAYNIWQLNARNMAFINYKFKTPFIPAGSRVRIDEIESGETNSAGFTLIQQDSSQSTPEVTFTVLDTGSTFTLKFNKKYQPATTFAQAMERTFVKEDFDALTAGLQAEEIAAIRKGMLVRGMSKRAVLICYGYPPSHHTASLDGSKWLYWASRNGRFAVTFDPEGRATSNGHKVHSLLFDVNPVPTEAEPAPAAQ
ncbi:MAG: hypothetical protein KDJ24_08025, partial [Gammaproteobacteria bacterium]|nr:hypothetical protein [Gammaproteobacteria bacterium]